MQSKESDNNIIANAAVWSDVGRWWREKVKGGVSLSRWLGEMLYAPYQEKMKALRLVNDKIFNITKNLDDLLKKSKKAYKAKRYVDLSYYLFELYNIFETIDEAHQDIKDDSENVLEGFYESHISDVEALLAMHEKMSKSASDIIVIAGFLEDLARKFIYEKARSGKNRERDLALSKLLGNAENTIGDLEGYLTRLSTYVASGDIGKYIDVLNDMVNSQSSFRSDFANIYTQYLQEPLERVIEENKENIKRQKEDQYQSHIRRADELLNELGKSLDDKTKGKVREQINQELLQVKEGAPSFNLRKRLYNLISLNVPQAEKDISSILPKPSIEEESEMLPSTIEVYPLEYPSSELEPSEESSIYTRKTLLSPAPESVEEEPETKYKIPLPKPPPLKNTEFVEEEPKTKYKIPLPKLPPIRSTEHMSLSSLRDYLLKKGEERSTFITDIEPLGRATTVLTEKEEQPIITPHDIEDWSLALQHISGNINKYLDQLKEYGADVGLEPELDVSHREALLPPEPVFDEDRPRPTPKSEEAPLSLDYSIEYDESEEKTPSSLEPVRLADREFIKVLKQASKLNSPHLLASTILKYSEIIEEKDLETSLKLISIVEGILNV